MICPDGSAYLLLAKVVRKVGNHDLGLAGNAILRGTALLAGAVGVGLASLVDIETLLAGGGGNSLVGGLGERKNLARNVGGSSAVGGSVSLAVDSTLSSLTLLAATAASSTATTATTATAGRLATTGSTLTTLGGGLGSGLGLAGELDGNLAVKDGLAVQLLDSAVGLRGGGDVNEGVADRASGARVGGDRGGLTVKDMLALCACDIMNSRFLNLHKVVLEEVLQLSLGGRVGEVSNVQSPTLSGAGDNGLVLRRVDRLVTAGANGGALGGGSRLVESSVCHLGGGSFDGHVDDRSVELMSWWKAGWSACEVLRDICLSRPPCWWKRNWRELVG